MTLKSLQQYGKGFQLKVLGSLLTDKKFLLNVRDVLYPEYWDADSHKWIITQITDYFLALRYALLFVPNFFFMGDNYFSPEISGSTILLHTWSLGIEEQFYIFFPIFFSNALDLNFLFHLF